MEREANLPVPPSRKDLLHPPPSDSHSSHLSTSSSSSSSPVFLRHVQAAFKRYRPLCAMKSNIRPRRVLLPGREPSNASTREAAEDSQDLDAVRLAGCGDCEKKVQFSVGENENSPQKMEWDASNGIDIPPRPGQKLHQQVEVSDGGISSLLAKRSQFPAFTPREINHPMVQSSVVGSSCMTTTSVHSKSAPMYVTSSSSCPGVRDSSSHMEVEPVDGLNVNPHPMSQGNPVQQTVRNSSGTSLADSSAAHTQLSVSSLENHVRVPGLPTGKNVVALAGGNGGEQGFADHAKGSSHIEDKLTKAKGNPVDVTDVQSQAPMTKDSSTNLKPEPPKSDKGERVASSKGPSGSRKKNYDPDLFFKVNGKLYQKLGKIGSGGSSEVHKVISSDCTIYALKKIKLKGRDYSTAYGFCQEIEYLNKLKGKSNIIQLIDYEVTDKVLLEEVMSGSMNMKDGRIRGDEFIYVVLEYGEIDLAHMLAQKWKAMDSSSWSIDENWLRFYWQQILEAVNTIHEERIVHSDLKPANFLLVKGSLKLIDFGIAKAIMSDTTNIQRDAQVGTLSYMSPEAFMCNENDVDGNTIKCGRPSDIWSLGCILYQMVYGRTPFSEYKTFWAKFKVITDRNHEIVYGPVSNPWLLDLMKKCLAWERNDRWRIPQLLQHPFLVPPITTPSQLSLLPDQSCQLFQKIAETHANNNEVSRLCCQLQQLLTGTVPTINSDFSTERDQHCSLLSQVSRLCSQLQQQLTDPE